MKNLTIIINVVVFCTFKAGNVSFDKTESWFDMNSANIKIILVQNKLEEIDFSC